MDRGPRQFVLEHPSECEVVAAGDGAESDRRAGKQQHPAERQRDGERLRQQVGATKADRHRDPAAEHEQVRRDGNRREERRILAADVRDHGECSECDLAGDREHRGAPALREAPEVEHERDEQQQGRGQPSEADVLDPHRRGLGGLGIGDLDDAERGGSDTGGHGRRGGRSPWDVGDGVHGRKPGRRGARRHRLVVATARSTGCDLPTT